MHHSQRTQRLPCVHEALLRIHVLMPAIIAASVLASPAVADDANVGQAQQVPAETSQPANISSQAPTTPPAPATPPPAPTPPPAAQAPAPKAPPAETPAMVLNGQQVESILGKKVRSTAGDDMGRIIDIIADKTGQVRAAIVDFGGFLGVGNRQIAVDWKAIRFPSDGKTDAVTVDLSKDQLRVAPVYKPGEQIVVLGPQPASPPASATAAPPPAPAAAATPPAPTAAASPPPPAAAASPPPPAAAANPPPPAPAAPPAPTDAANPAAKDPSSK